MAVLSRVLSIFFLMLIGYIARRTKVLAPTMMQGLSGLLLNVAIPFTILASFDRSIPHSAIPDLLQVAVWAIAIHGFAIVMSVLIYRKFPHRERSVLSYITVFSNCGFMGFPVVLSVFGKVGVMYASVYVVVFNIFLWTYGISLFERESSGGKLLKVITNPGNVSVVIGFIIWLLPFNLPASITGSIDMVSNMTTPLSMIVVGATLADVPLKGIFKGAALWWGTAVRLLVLPLLVYFLMRFAGIDSLPAKVSMFLVAMPAAAQTVIFAERYGADVELASRLVFLTTILSTITIPAFTAILGV
jgi:predicted permease